MEDQTSQKMSGQTEGSTQAVQLDPASLALVIEGMVKHMKEDRKGETGLRMKNILLRSRLSYQVLPRHPFHQVLPGATSGREKQAR